MSERRRLDQPIGTRLGYDLFETESGWAALMWSRRGVVGCSFAQRSPEAAALELRLEMHQATYRPEPGRPARRRLEEFFRGVPVTFDDLRIDTSGVTPFVGAAWEAARAIPPGETRTYGWLAMEAGRPGAARAAGNAMAHCPLSPIVPCHRVVGTSGVLHGYGRDPEIKRFLMAMEWKLAEVRRSAGAAPEIWATNRAPQGAGPSPD